MSNHNYAKTLKDATEKLRDPFRFRVFVAAVAILIAYLGIYTPLSGKIDKTKKALAKESKRESLAQDVDLLRAQTEFFLPRMSKDADANEWIQYILNGVRGFPLELANLDSDAERRVGPYRAVAMRLSVSGKMQDLDALLHWLDTNQRLIRIDVISIEPVRGGDDRLMQLTLLGLKG